jgi:RecA/RadA recombinase
MTEDQLKHLQAVIDKDYGKGIFTDASAILATEPEILPTTPSLDIALSGGIPEGSWVTLSGKPKSGKSCLALTLAAAAQAQGRTVVYADVEARLKRKNLAVRGLDTSPEKFGLIRSNEEKLLSGVDFLNQILLVLETVPRVFVIIDSVSALAEKKEMEEGAGVEIRGGINKKLSTFCRVAGQAVMVNKAIVVGMTHRYANLTGWGSLDVEKAGASWRHQRDVCLKVKKSEAWVVADRATLTGEREIGRKVSWVVEESAMGAPSAGEVNTFLRYGMGYDGTMEFLHLGLGFGFVHKADKGGTYTFNFLGGKKPPTYRGEARAYAALAESPETLDALKKLVLDKLSGPTAGDDE